MANIDFREPFITEHIFIAEVPTKSGVSIKELTSKVSIEWKNILHIEEFVKNWMFNNNSNKTAIVTVSGAFTVLAEFEEVQGAWRAYKLWASNKDILFKMN